MNMLFFPVRFVLPFYIINVPDLTEFGLKTPQLFGDTYDRPSAPYFMTAFLTSTQIGLPGLSFII
jgi:hypothetical protein